MNIRPNLDHDGLDGILPATIKQPFILKYLKPIVFFVILTAIALFVIWPENNAHVSQLIEITEFDKQSKLPVEVSELKNLNTQENKGVMEGIRPKEPVILENQPTQLNAIQINEHGVTVSEPEMPDELTDLKLNESDKTVLQSEVDSDIKTPESFDQPVLISIDDSQRNTTLAAVFPDKPYTLLFGFASSNIKPLSNDQKQDLTDFVNRCNNGISIVGHTCNKGSAVSNRLLGMARAKEVSRVLIELGANQNTLTTLSEGMEKPVASNATRAERMLNRRVEIRCVSE